MKKMYDVITIGTAARDVFLSSNSFKVLKDQQHLAKIGFPTGEAECFALGAKIEVNRPFFTTGGGAVNCGITFRRMGLKVAVFCKVGKDTLGDEIVSTLKREKISSFVARDSKIGTAYSTVLLTPGGERTILVYRGASETLSQKEVSFSKLNARWAYIVPGHISFPLMLEIISMLKKRNTRIAMNPSRFYLDANVVHLKSLLRQLDVVIVNREEAAYLTGLPYSDEKGIFRKFDELIRGIAVITDGSRGAKVSDGTHLYTAGIFKEKKMVDRTGAGDAFGAGFVAGLIEKDDIHYALRVGSANATSVVESIGAQEGILFKKDLKRKRWQQYLNLDIDPL